MAAFEEFTKAVRNYQKDNLKNSKFEVTQEPYDLDEDWNLSYPFCHDAGVYAIFDKDKKLLYIGKASNNSNIGARLGSYFKNGEPGKFALKHSLKSWETKPKYILAAKVNQPFQAPSLEEYLIQKLEPSTNSVGRRY